MIDLLRERENSEQVHHFSRRAFVGHGFVTKNSENEPKVEKNSGTKSVVSGSDERGLRGVKTTGFLRFYYSNIGRWISRDPIGEKGGVNIYTILNNDLISNCDPLGLDGSNAEPVFKVNPAIKLNEGEAWPTWDIFGTQWSVGGTRWISRSIFLVATVDPNNNAKESSWIQSANSEVSLWYRIGNPIAQEHEEQHVTDINEVWEDLVDKSISFTGCCKKRGWTSCYQKVISEYLNYAYLLSKCISATRHASSSRVMGYEGVRKVKAEAELTRFKAETIDALTKARIDEAACAKLYDGGPPPDYKINTTTTDINNILNKYTQ